MPLKFDFQVSAYVTFSNHNEALNAIKHLDNTVQDGHVLRCSFGTTKYCNSFLQGRECTIPDCMYLHKIQETEDTYLRAQLSKGQDSRSRAEFHDKTHPQFMQAQQEQARPPEVKLHTEYRPNNRDHSNQSVALPAPLPRASSVNSKRGSQEQASSRTAMAQPAIPIPRPAAPKQLQAPKQQQVSPPAIAAIGMRDKGTSKAGSDGSAPSVSNSDPVVPNEPSSAPRIAPGMAWDCAAEPPKVRADNNLPSAVAPTDQVASAASAALSSDSLFSAFANSQHQQQQPGTAGVVGDQLWGQDWGGQSNANPTGQVFGGPAGFSLWGNTPAAAPAPLGMGGSVDPWRTAPNNEPMPAPQAQPQDWQSAFRALLPDVNVHFESSVPPQPQQPSNLPVAAANSNQNESGNIWGAGFAPFGSPTAEQQSGANNGTSDSSFATTWNLPAMLQPPGGSDALGSNSNEANSLWQSGAFGISVPNLPAPQPLESSGDRTAATNSSGNNINSGNNGNGGSNRRTRGGKKRGGKNKNNS